MPGGLTHGLARLALILAAPVILAGRVFAFEPLFDTWIGYDTGVYANGRFPWAVASADFDGDGDTDLAVANWPWSPGFSILLNAGDGTYGAPVHYTSAEPPLDIDVADFDRDGRIDVVVPNTGQNWEGTTVSVFRNLGAGSFGAGQQFTAVSGALGVAAADFDGDGWPDVAVAGYAWSAGDGSVVVLRGNGSGGFLAPASHAVAAYPYKLQAADLNGDDRPDLALAHEYQRISVLINDGAGGFAPYASYSTGIPEQGGDFYPCIAVADLDRDGDRDLAYSSTRVWDTYTGGFVRFANSGDGTMEPPTFVNFSVPWSAGMVSLAMADLDGDLWPDVVGAHHDDTAGGGFFVALADGAGGFNPGTGYPAGQAPAGVTLADADTDGHIDVVAIATYSLEATVHLNSGDGVFPTPPTFAAGGHHIDCADADGDGDLDLASSQGYAGSGSIFFVRGRGDGTFDAPIPYVAPTAAYAVKFEDLDGDDSPDLLWIDDFPPYWGRWRRNLGGGVFGPTVTIPLPNCGAGDIDGFDLDADGDIDVVATEEGACAGSFTSYIDIALNRGDGTFNAAYRVDLLDSGPREVTGGDFNGDGNMDLAVGMFGAYGANNKVVVLLGNGEGTFFSRASYPVGQGPDGITAVDLNGDGALDLATDNAGSGGSGQETMSVLIGRGDGTFQPAATYPGSYSPTLLGTTAIVAGDADRDGDHDLMVLNCGSNDVSFYANRGDGTFDRQIRYGVGTRGGDLLYADFTGDGIGDLAASGGDVAIVRGLGGIATDVAGGAASGLPADPVTRVDALDAAPNPFGAEILLHFVLGHPRQADLAIYDVTGRRVATLVSGSVSGGAHAIHWNGRSSEGEPVGTGVYFARLVTSDGAVTAKILRKPE